MYTIIYNSISYDCRFARLSLLINVYTPDVDYANFHYYSTSIHMHACTDYLPSVSRNRMSASGEDATMCGKRYKKVHFSASIQRHRL